MDLNYAVTLFNNINITNSNLTQTIHVTKVIYNCLNNRKHNVKFITTVFDMVPK